MIRGSTSRRWVAAVLATGLAMTGVGGMHVSSVHAMGAGPAESAADSVLEVTVDAETSRRELIRGWAQERSLQVFARRPTALEEGDRIEVEISGQSRDYRVVLRLLRHGKAIPDQPPPLRCSGAYDELLALVETAVDDAMDRLIAAHQAEVVGRQYLTEERFERHDTAQKEAEAERRREALEAEPYRPAALGALGAVSMVLGGGAVVGGAILTARGQLESQNDLLGPTDIRTPGIVLLGVGSALIVAGIGMLAADVVRCNKDRVACGERGPRRRTARRVELNLRGVALRW